MPIPVLEVLITEDMRNYRVIVNNGVHILQGSVFSKQEEYKEVLEYVEGLFVKYGTGMCEDINSNMPNQFWKEYEFLKRKYKTV